MAEYVSFPVPEELPYIDYEKYEYLDHTADVQFHSWGDTMQEAFENCGIALFGYMTAIETVEIDRCYQIEAEGTDYQSLMFHFLDELLFLFSAEPYVVCCTLEITEFSEFKLKCKCYGEVFTLGKHPQGTEVKAITYSNMQVYYDEESKKYNSYVIVDI